MSDNTEAQTCNAYKKVFSAESICNDSSLSFFTDEIMQQEIRPLLAVDIIEHLHRQFALLSGEK